jgi:hypothetical protein
MESKDLLVSKTTIGVLIAVLGPILVHYGLPPEMAGEIVNLGISVVGGLIALYGNLTRSTKIGSVAGIKIGETK